MWGADVRDDSLMCMRLGWEKILMFMMLFPNNNCTIFMCRFKVIVFQIQLQEVIHSHRKQSDGETDCGRKAIRRCDFNLDLKVHNDLEDLTNRGKEFQILDVFGLSTGKAVSQLSVLG